MALRVKHWFTGLIGEPQAPEVHFHTGPDTLPAACFDSGCGIPRLDV